MFPSASWGRPETLGNGEIDWLKFIDALFEVNYSGNAGIEGEDDAFEMPSALEKPELKSNIIERFSLQENDFILGYMWGNAHNQFSPAQILHNLIKYILYAEILRNALDEPRPPLVGVFYRHILIAES